ncbi:MAG TPA: hypothetical protein VFS92_08610 [Planctomycetota bacterium]|nr:hypothetical protein [Planctomycetota bacterium]
MRSAAATAVVALALAAAAPSRAETADLDLPAGGTLRSTIFPSTEVETVRVAGPAGAVAAVDLRPLGRTVLRPSLLATLSDGTEVEPVPSARGRVKVQFPFAVDGTLVLRVGSAVGSGHYRLRVRVTPRPAGLRPARADMREAGDPLALSGDYSLLAFDIGGPAPAAFTGGVEFLRRGRARTDLVAAAIPPVGAGTPIAVHGGSWFAAGPTAAISLDLGDGARLSGEYGIAAGGDVLHAGLGDADAALVSLILREGPPATTASLAGTWTYAVTAGEGDAATLEAGSLTLGPAGTVSGFGARSPLAGGGEPTPILRSGTFAVQADGSVVLTTRENFIGPQSTWTVRDAFAGDVLAGLPEGTGDAGLRLLLRQGTGLGNSDFAGAYLHLGATLGTTTALRSGTVVLDGAGSFSGTGAVIPVGGEAQEGVAVSGTYSVNALGNATLAFGGGAAATGVAGPEARTLLAVGGDEAGLSVDLLLRAE